MTDHVLHLCKVFGKAETHKTRLGWPHDEIPLNRLRHAKCPYCGESTEKMTPATGHDVAILNVDPQSSVYIKRGGGSMKSDFSASLLEEVKKLRDDMKKLREEKQPKKDENKESDK